LRSFFNVSLAPSPYLMHRSIGQGLAALATETSTSGPQGYPTGEVYDFVPDVQQYPSYGNYDPSGAESTSLSYLIRIARDQGLGSLCPTLARLDLQYGRNYTTVKANDVFTLHGQAFTQIPVTTHQGNRYLVFARQLPQAGFVAYSLCGVAAGGQVGYPCHPPDPGKYTCAFKSLTLCVVDFVVFGQSLSAAHTCDSLGSCALATVGVAASLFVVGRLTVGIGARVAVAASLATEGLSALTARIVTDESLVEVTDARSGVNEEISTSEAQSFIKALESCKCFPAGTKVATRSGSVAIEKLHVGDLVLSEDPKKGKVEQERVQAIIVRPMSSMMALKLSDGSTITVQPDHPFWVDAGRELHGKGWLKARQLHAGDRLRTASGRDVRIVRILQHAGRAVVYTLTVAHDHTFFIGDAEVLVHNCALPVDQLDALGQTADDIMSGSLRIGKSRYHGDTRHAIDINDAINIVKSPEAIYVTTGSSHRLIFLKDETIVLVTSQFETRSGAGGALLTAYGKKGVLGETGASAVGGDALPTGPGRPVTEADILNGTIPGINVPSIKIRPGRPYVTVSP